VKEETRLRLISSVGPKVVAALARTLRIEVRGLEHRRAVEESGRPHLLACLHGRMFLPVWMLRHDGYTALVSQSRDGELVSRLVAGLGIATVRGSSTRGGSVALKATVRLLQEGNLTAVMVDGPRGPREEVKVGTLAIARLAGVPILPLTAGAWPAWEFHSWDRFQLPRPFARGVMVYGEPLEVPREAKGEALEELRLELQRRLVAAREEADRLLGRRS